MKKLVFLLVILGINHTVLAEDPVYFADPNLKTAVEAELGITDPNESDVLELTFLDASGLGIIDISGIEYATNITTLRLYNNNITHISPVSGLTNLINLGLGENQISDISPLSGLDSLDNLVLYHNQISDTSPLSGLTNLTYLNLFGNNISDISPLSGLTNMLLLYLHINQISDISPLSNMRYMEQLQLSANQISDISPLASMTNMNRLRLYNNPIDQGAYCIYLPLIERNNPGIDLIYDPKPDTYICEEFTLYVDDNAPQDPGPNDPDISDPNENGSIDHPFDTIQEAIDLAFDGDTVMVLDGTYTGMGNRDIDPNGLSITIRSENGPETCIIDCQGNDIEPHRGFYIHSNEDPNCIIEGFTVTNGYTHEGGGGIICYGNSRPSIKKCIISDNSVIWSVGGGIACYGSSSPRISECIIVGNATDEHGGGIGADSSAIPIIDNCIFSNNVGFFGGGFHGKASFTNCTFTNNLAVYGGGMSNYSNNNNLITVTNCIFWNNIASIGGNEIALLNSPSSITMNINFSNIHAGLAGIYDENNDPNVIWYTFNIDTDPLFADPNNGDFHLQSQAGRYNPTTQSWVIDSVTSPCIDAGDPSTPIGWETFPNGGVVNMGAYGATTEASKTYFGTTPCETPIAGDINGDCRVDLLDFSIMAFHWLEDNN